MNPRLRPLPGSDVYPVVNAANVTYRSQVLRLGLSLVTEGQMTDWQRTPVATTFPVQPPIQTLPEQPTDRRPPPISPYAAAKRTLDVLFTLLLLPALLPSLLIVAGLVRLSSPGPVLFWQVRVGRGGSLFRLVKFRSMTLDAEQHGPSFAALGDSRVTRIGRVLRQYRLDELPQFWNVLRGEMSIIGPRPEQRSFSQDFERELSHYALRHCVRPGITGWAQVNQGYAEGLAQTAEKLRYDLDYIERLSVWLDAHIVLRTLKTMLSGFGSR